MKKTEGRTSRDTFPLKKVYADSIQYIHYPVMHGLAVLSAVIILTEFYLSIYKCSQIQCQ
jgi:hypothetical protein